MFSGLACNLIPKKFIHLATKKALIPILISVGYLKSVTFLLNINIEGIPNAFQLVKPISSPYPVLPEAFRLNRWH